VEYTAMKLDTASRQQLTQALQDTQGREVVSIITLPNDVRLRLSSHFGHIAIELICDDLFDQMIDVSALVIADLENNRD
jgi:hypothetical protein